MELNKLNMTDYVFKIGEHFAISVVVDRDKKGLEAAAGERFSSFEALEDYILPYNAHVGKKRNELPENFIAHTLPFTINRLPVYYEHPAGDLIIGNAEVVLKRA
jgi:hypothetical protein